jgi:uncharacterized membrane protein
MEEFPERNPDHYVWGLFYYNKDDSRLFPPKPIPDMGFTLNFAQPKAVVGFVAFLAFFTFVMYMIISRQQ